MFEKEKKKQMLCKTCGQWLVFSETKSWTHKDGKIYAPDGHAAAAIQVFPNEESEARADLKMRYGPDTELEDKISSCLHVNVFDHQIGKPACLKCGSGRGEGF